MNSHGTTTTPIPATEHYRPAFHFTPARNWMNDPNGLVYVDGTFHLFFQFNPEGEEWGNMSWGHATSEDLVTWTERPVAIRFTPDEQVYSGSIVVDHDNTSGLGDGLAPPLVAIYTSVYPDGRQAQSLAVSTDGGTVWNRGRDNPVLDRDSSDFRDPKVFRAADATGHERWIMVTVEAELRQVLVYSSPNLRDWTFESAFGPVGPQDLVWECPDLFPLDVDGDPRQRRWVLIVSTNRLGADGGSATWYFIGDFDGHAFTPDNPDRWTRLDHGNDFYAAVSFDNMPERSRTLIGWANNWQYAAQIPTRPWRGTMSLPREVRLTLRGGTPILVQDAPRALGSDKGDPSRRHGPAPLEEPIAIRPGRHYRLDVEWEVGNASSVGVDLFDGAGDRARLRFEASSGELSLDRSLSGSVDFHPDFDRVSRAHVPLRDGRLSLRVFVDASVIEVFADGGAVTITDQVFPGVSRMEAVVFADGGCPSVTVDWFPLDMTERPRSDFVLR